MVDKIRYLCRLRGISFAALEKELGFANGSLAKSDNKIQSIRLKAIADYFGVSMDYFFNDDVPQYYIKPETAAAAQELFENKELRVLFDTVRDADPEDLKALHTMALALKRKERGYDD